MIGERTVPEEEWRVWNDKYQVAAALLDNRDRQLAQVRLLFVVRTSSAGKVHFLVGTTTMRLPPTPLKG